MCGILTELAAYSFFIMLKAFSIHEISAACEGRNNDKPAASDESLTFSHC